jgi:polyisoprenoid-binding protein YceI
MFLNLPPNKTGRALAATLAAALLLTHLARAETVRFNAEPGASKIKIDGTSTIHDWSVDCNVIGGFMELEATFLDGKSAPSAVKPRVEVNVPVRQLKSGKKSMDTVMHDAMKQAQHSKIDYKVLELTPKPGQAAGASSQFDARGALTIAGVTRTNVMPVTISRLDEKKLKVIGATNLKMTDFGIKPPAPEIGLGLIKTGDEVKLTFDWTVVQAAPKAP